MLLNGFLTFPTVRPILPPVYVDVSGSGSADHSASGEFSGESSTFSASGDDSYSPPQVFFEERPDIYSADHSTSGYPQEAEGEHDVHYTSGESGSTSGYEEEHDRQHSGYGVSESGISSGSGDISGGGGDSRITMVDGQVVEVSTYGEHTEQELGRGGIDTSRGYVEPSASGSASGEFSGITFVDHGAVDQTVQPSGEQEVSGYRPHESEFHRGVTSGFPSGVSSSGSASEDSLPHRGDVIYLTDNDMMEVTVSPPTRHPEQGRGVVEVSGEGSGPGIHHDISGTWDQSWQFSGSGVPHEKPSEEELSVTMPPGSQITYTEYIDSLGQSGVEEEGQEMRSGTAVYEVTSDTGYTSATTAPSVSLGTPAVVEQPRVEECT